MFLIAFRRRTKSKSFTSDVLCNGLDNNGILCNCSCKSKLLWLQLANTVEIVSIMV